MYFNAHSLNENQSEYSVNCTLCNTDSNFAVYKKRQNLTGRVGGLSFFWGGRGGHENVLKNYINSTSLNSIFTPNKL